MTETNPDISTLSLNDSDSPSPSSVVESLESIESRHRKELKALQSQITALKKRVGNDKKRKKEVQVEIAKMEHDLKERQEQELKDFHQRQETDDNGKPDPTSVDAVSSEPSNQNDHSNTPTASPKKKVNKQKLRKEKRAALEEQMRREAEAEAAAQPNMQKVELDNLIGILKPLNLGIHEIKADGHCLYNAISDQLHHNAFPNRYSFSELRSITSKYMREHPKQFLPFLVNERTGEMYTQEDYDRYCDELETSAVWGGQLEVCCPFIMILSSNSVESKVYSYCNLYKIQALSQALELPIHIYQMNTPVLKVGEDFESSSNGLVKDPLVISYHRHMFGLGEHYNSLRRVTEPEPQKE
ncbi:hypothetical protein BKA69DRAFT_522225 [Paraphysoderma sedebokerense]|nr:hypothetical protein BKA69DRAFT_522225 [Paraphysoderma sedebokerense]